MIDPQAIILPDLPPEWSEIPPELLVKLAPNGAFVTPEQRAQINKIAAGRHFLIRNDLRVRCRSCRQGKLPGAIHDYLTMHCIEIPFNGLRDLTLFLQESEHGRTIYSAMRAGSIVPISAVDAARLNARIRERGGETIAMQRPMTPDDLDAATIRRRIVKRAVSLR